MEIYNGAILQSEEGEHTYPFAELSRLRNDAGAFMQHALSDEADDEEMDDEPMVITPDYPLYGQAHAPSPPYHRPIAIQPTQQQQVQTQIPSANSKGA